MTGPLGLGITESEAFDPTLTWVSVEEALRHPQAPHAAEGWLRKFARAVEQTTDGVCITGSTGIIEYVNPAFEALTGYPRQVLVGQSTRVLRSDAHDSAFYQRLWQTVLAGRVFRDVFLDRNAAGQHLHLDQTITPVRDARGRVTHFVVVARDVSARMRTENALRRLTESLEQQAKWIAQTLHDEAGQYLTAAHLALADAEAGLDAAGRDRLQAARLHLERVEEELRRLAHEVHPRILDDIGLTGAIEQLASGIERRRGIPRESAGAAAPAPPGGRADGRLSRGPGGAHQCRQALARVRRLGPPRTGLCAGPVHGHRRWGGVRHGRCARAEGPRRRSAWAFEASRTASRRCRVGCGSRPRQVAAPRLRSAIPLEQA